MKLPEPQTRTFSSLFSDLEEKGQIKIPQFQRDFVWSIQKSAGLMDSIIKGYPIGTFIFWKTKDRLRAIRNIGNQDLPEPEEGESIDYVLDGQQRLTSLYACLKGLSIKRKGDKKIDDFSKIYINLESNEDEKIVTIEIDKIGNIGKKYISILDLGKGDIKVLNDYPTEHHEKIQMYRTNIASYQILVIQVKDAPIDIATEIFTRINVSGRSLSLFEIMAAKTFDQKKNFDLSEKFKKLIKVLKLHDYETISDTIVLQVISIIISNSKECTRQVILKLDKTEFIDIWGKAVDAIERAVEYFKNYYRIPVSKLLPYNALIVPFSYFFFHHKDKPTGDKQKYLEDFFWRCSLSERYSSSVEGKLVQDVKRIDSILEDKLPTYDWSIDSSTDFIINNGWFSVKRSYIKAILCIFAYHEPKSFNDNSKVNIGNNWLKQANSKNYHHFSPKAFLKNKGKEDRYINHILNITIVDDFLNKREIGAKAPSEYMRKFKKINPELDSTMKLHLINDLDKFGIWDDDYDTFFENRAKLLHKEIEKRIIKKKIDRKPQPEIQDDYEGEPTVAE